MYCTCHENWARGIRNAAPPTRNHHHVQNQTWRQVHKTRLSTFSKRRSSSSNTALARKMTSKTTSHFDPRHACQRFSNIQKVSESATPAMRMSKCPAQNDVSDLKMSRNATPATQNGLPHKMAIAQKTSTKPRWSNETFGRDQSASRILPPQMDPDLTPGLNTYRKNPSVWTHCLGNSNMYTPKEYDLVMLGGWTTSTKMSNVSHIKNL